jgi:hypothetical protein
MDINAVQTKLPKGNPNELPNFRAWMIGDAIVVCRLQQFIEAFLAAVERVLPDQFLATVTGQRIVAKHPGAFF